MVFRQRISIPAIGAAKNWRWLARRGLTWRPQQSFVDLFFHPMIMFCQKRSHIIVTARQFLQIPLLLAPTTRNLNPIRRSGFQ